MGKGARNRKIRKEALAAKERGDTRPIKSIARSMKKRGK